MANYESLKSAIRQVIKPNGNEEITGQVLQDTLISLVSSVGQNATFAGVAVPTTNPQSPDGNVFYLATQNGTYANFGGIVVADEVAILSNVGGSWAKISTDITTKDFESITKSFVYPTLQGRYFNGTAVVATSFGFNSIVFAVDEKRAYKYYGATLGGNNIAFFEDYPVLGATTEIGGIFIPEGVYFNVPSGVKYAMLTAQESTFNAPMVQNIDANLLSGAVKANDIAMKQTQSFAPQSYYYNTNSGLQNKGTSPWRCVFVPVFAETEYAIIGSYNAQVVFLTDLPSTIQTKTTLIKSIAPVNGEFFSVPGNAKWMIINSDNVTDTINVQSRQKINFADDFVVNDNAIVNGNVEIEEGYWRITGKGDKVASADYTRTKYMMQWDGEIKVKYFTPERINFYDAERQFISSLGYLQFTEVPSNAKYFTLFWHQKIADMSRVEVHTKNAIINTDYKTINVPKKGYYDEQGTFHKNDGFRSILFEVKSDKCVMLPTAYKKANYRSNYAFYGDFDERTFISANTTGIVPQGARFCNATITATIYDDNIKLLSNIVKCGDVVDIIITDGGYIKDDNVWWSGPGWRSSETFYADDDFCLQCLDADGGLMNTRKPLGATVVDASGSVVVKGYLHQVRVRKGERFWFYIGEQDLGKFKASTPFDKTMIAWYGTSIPAGSIQGEMSYPEVTSQLVGCRVTNEAKGGSRSRNGLMSGEWSGHTIHDLGQWTTTFAEIEARAEAWEDITADQVANRKSLSFEQSLIAKFLDEQNETYVGADVLVIDYGFNDYMTGVDIIDGVNYFAVEPSQDLITSGKLVADPSVTLQDGTIINLDVVENRNMFVGSMNFIMSLIRRYKPNQKVIFIDCYYDGINLYNNNLAEINKAIEFVAKKWGCEVVKTYEFSNVRPITIADVNLWQYYLPDNVHSGNEYAKMVAPKFAEVIKRQ